MERLTEFPFVEDTGASRLRMMFCFHHAGGSAAVFRPWTKYQERLMVVPVELPGKATRISEKPATDGEQLVGSLAGAMAEMINDQEYCVYGHSMGAMLGFKTAALLESEYGMVPRLMVVAGRHEPLRSPVSHFHSSQGEEALISELVRLGGTPAELLADRELLGWLLPQIIADYRIDETLVHRGEILSCPIHAHVGCEDTETPAELVVGWQAMTSAQFELRSFEGDHFSPTSRERPTTGSLRRRCARTRERRHGSATDSRITQEMWRRRMSDEDHARPGLRKTADHRFYDDQHLLPASSSS